MSWADFFQTSINKRLKEQYDIGRLAGAAEERDAIVAYLEHLLGLEMARRQDFDRRLITALRIGNHKPAAKAEEAK